MYKIVNLFAAALLAFGAASGHAQVYKWVDADGVTHYSQQPPVSGDATEVAVPGPAAAPADAQAPKADQPDPGAERRRASELSGEIRARRAEEARQQAALQAQRSAACDQMRTNLTTLREHARVRIQEGGSSRIMSPEEQAQQIIDLETKIRDNCSDAN